MAAHTEVEVRYDLENPPVVIVAGSFDAVFGESHILRTFPSPQDLFRYINRERVLGITETVVGAVGALSATVPFATMANTHAEGFTAAALAGVTLGLFSGGLGAIVHGIERGSSAYKIDAAINSSDLLSLSSPQHLEPPSAA